MICSLRTTEDVEKDSKIIKDMKLFPYEKTSNIPKHGDEVPEDMVITGVGHKRCWIECNGEPTFLHKLRRCRRKALCGLAEDLESEQMAPLTAGLMKLFLMNMV